MERSKAPWRARSSSMWSKKRIPVEISDLPRPSRLRRRRILVSLVWRRIEAGLRMAGLRGGVFFFWRGGNFFFLANGDGDKTGAGFFGGFGHEAATRLRFVKNV